MCVNCLPSPYLNWSLIVEHDFTPKGFLETANTLSCHQMGGLKHRSSDATPADMGKFQARHLLEAGYRIIYDPENAAKLLASGVAHGYVA